MEVKAAFIEDGGSEFHYIACLNENSDWIQGLQDIANTHLSGWPVIGISGEDSAKSRQAALAMGATD